MKTIQTSVVVDPGHTITLRLPDDIEPGAYQVTLVIDDQPEVRGLIVQVLEQNGYLLTHVLAAHGRDEAWMRLINHRPDLTARYRPDPV